jgi:tRNA pseudouridine55 synthase
VDGVIVVDKPRGPTSHDVVEAVRKKLNEKVGHTGTLDPMATGVLPLCVGRATLVSSLLTADDKAYEAEVTFGVETDTLDAQGKVLATTPVPEPLTLDLAPFRGTYPQTPPMFSAVKVGGRKLYEAARAGEEVERAPREVTVQRLELLSLEGNKARLAIECSKGFFVRVLAQELGKAAGCGAHLSALRRTKSGPFTLAQAVPPDRAEEGLIPLERALDHLPAVQVSAADVRKVKSGGVVEAAPVAGAVRVVAPDGALLAIADVVAGRLKYRRVLAVS